MSEIRPLEREDLPQVVSLHERIARSRSETLPPGLAEHLEGLFFDYPWADPELPPLVYVDDEKAVAGLIGSSVRRLLWDGRPARMRISSHLLADPEVRTRAAGAMLLRECLSGPQDLTVTDTANESSRRLWEGLGGTAWHLGCLGWIRVFRPWRFARAVLSWRGRDGLAATARPFAPALDSVSRRAFRPPPAKTRSEELTPEAFAAHVDSVTRTFRLRLAYEDADFSTWLLAELRNIWRDERLVARLVWADDQVRGWYVYAVKPEGVAEALHVAGADRDVGDVLDDLFHHAWSRGLSAVQGRVEPHLLDALAHRKCFFHASNSSALIHSRDTELLDAVHEGRGLLTRMDADWWIYGPWWDVTVGTSSAV